jgi:hypothetical protein
MSFRITAGCIAAVFALMGLRTPASAQGNRIHVCVGADQVLRLASGACPAGQTSYSLVLEGGGAPPPPNQDQALMGQINDLKKAVDFLKSQVSNLEHELAKQLDLAHTNQKFTAPFEVVDKAGKTIFRVKDEVHGFEMVNPAGQTVLWASALDQGGLFKTRSAATFPEVVMGSVGNLGAFVIRDGENQDRASLKLSNGKPVLGLYNDSHTEIASLSQGETGGGRLALGLPSGDAGVLAGIIPGRNCGAVNTYPLAGAARTMVGAAPTFIQGKC